ncbi:MAG: hypothetical protein ACLQDV_14970 [Candidatus Binataceae bacterium]
MSVSPTPTPTASAVITPTATATATSTATPTPQPTARGGTIVAPAPITVSAGAGQTVGLGSFTYTNVSQQAQNLGSVVVLISDPSMLSSLTVTASPGGESATVTSIAASTTLTFSAPIAIDAGESVSFSLTGVTAGASAMNAAPLAYASILGGGGSGPPAPLSTGMLMLGVLLIPLGIRQRRRATLIAFALLIVTAAGCGGSSSSGAPATQSAAVDNNGNLNRSPFPS